MFDKLTTVESRYEELMARVGTVEVQADPAEFKKARKALSELEPLVEKFREYKTVEQDIAGAQELAKGSDAEMRELPHFGVCALHELLGALKVLLDGLVLAELLDERLELGKLLGGFPELGGIGLHLGRPEARHQVVVLTLDGAELVEHIQEAGSWQ